MLPLMLPLVNFPQRMWWSNGLPSYMDCSYGGNGYHIRIPPFRFLDLYWLSNSLRERARQRACYNKQLVYHQYPVVESVLALTLLVQARDPRIQCTSIKPSNTLKFGLMFSPIAAGYCPKIAHPIEIIHHHKRSGPACLNNQQWGTN